MPRVLNRHFVRVVERDGWDVEFIEPASAQHYRTRDRAMAAARASSPDWIEVGVLVPESPDKPRHHSWSTLRRAPGGDYLPSGLSWGPGRAG